MENKQFFDPYNFNNVVTNTPCAQNAVQLPDDIAGMSNTGIPNLSPIMFYEQQFWYYNYLTKMLEYKIKLKEYENLNNK